MVDEKKLRKVIALDFDGCLCSDSYPEIGLPNWGVINRAIEEKENGAALILWTCRQGDLLDAAIKACASWGINLDGVNESLSEWSKAYGNNTRKIGATEFWDDRAVRMPDEHMERRTKEIGQKAVEKWGSEAQILMAVEEMAELQKALLKLIRWEKSKKGNLSEIMDNIAEERADVEIMLKQLEIMTGSCQEWKASKLERLEARLRGIEKA